METADLAVLSTGQIGALTTAQIGAPTTDQAVTLTTTQIASFSSKQLGALKTDDIAALSTGQVAALSSKAIAGLTTAQVDWVAILNAPTITWEFPERADSKGAIAREMIRAGIISEADADAFAQKNIVWRDAMWTAAASHILRRHRPNLLLFHLLNLDSTQHRYGPRTPAALTVRSMAECLASSTSCPTCAAVWPSERWIAWTTECASPRIVTVRSRSVNRARWAGSRCRSTSPKC